MARPLNAPNYGRDTVLQTLDSLGIDLLNGDEGGWKTCSCPLHTERKPSFTINVDEGGWMCRSQCGSNADLAVLVYKLTGEDLKTIRRKLRMHMVTKASSILELVSGPKRNPAPDLGKPEALFYERRHVPKYMLSRGFTLETLKKWQVGYDPGLNAVAIPIKVEGKLVGLVRRSLNPNDAKYKNSRGLSKNFLFGLEHVPSEAKAVIVVEGPLDCMWLEQYGYPAVAILGSSMSPAQADLLKRRFWKLVLAFDDDKAGRHATENVSQELARLDQEIISIPAGKNDIQECDEETLKKLLTSKL